MLYFAYGSNLNLRQMERRCPDAVPLYGLILGDTRLVFRMVADVLDEPGAKCPGGIWRITPECEDALDHYEGYDPRYPERGMYRKRIIEVTGLPNGESEVMFYQMNSTGICPPSQGYFEGIRQGYKDFGLMTGPLMDALEHSYLDKRPTHVERQRLRRTGRPAFQPRAICKNAGSQLRTKR